MRKAILLIGICGFVLVGSLSAQKNTVAKPLYDDPVYHGAADPVIIYNKQKKKWWMLYTNRRASIEDSTVAWVHGTRIGIAESSDGSKWKYVDTCSINYHPDAGYTFWAPDVIYDKGAYHMYLTYVPGTFTDWNHPRVIIHLTSTDLQHWNYQSTLKLFNEKVIDASVYKINDSLYRLWYNNERDGKSIYYADSRDLYHWTDKGKAIATRGEGPKVFFWQQQYFMIVDAWKGMEIFSSNDLLNWKKQPTRILENPGKGKDDQAMGGHCDVVVNNGKAYVFYFTHPGRRKDQPAPKGSFDDKRSVIQLGELKFVNARPDDTVGRGEITCDRDENVSIKLIQPSMSAKDDVVLSDKALNIFTLGDSNGTFPFSWPVQLKQALPNSQIFNISKSGRTIGFVNLGDSSLNSLLVADENLKKAADFTKDRQFDYIVIELGTNDGKNIFNDQQEAVPLNLEKLIHKIKSSTYSSISKAKIIIISPPPYGIKAESTEKYMGGGKRMEKLNREFEKIAKQNGCLFVSGFATPGLDMNAMSPDGIHLDAVASRKLIEPVVELMTK